MDILWFLGGIFVGVFAMTLYLDSNITPLLKDMTEELEDEDGSWAD